MFCTLVCFVLTRPFGPVLLEWCHVSIRLQILFWRLSKQLPPPPASGTHSFHHRTPSPCSNPLGQINTFIETIISDCALTLKKSVFVSCWMEFLTFVLFLENRGQKKKNAFLFSFLSPSLHGGTTQCCHVLTTVTFLWNSCVGWRLVGSSSVEINPRLRK